MTLGQLIGSLGIQKCDMLKIDIEGSEYEVLTGAAETLNSGVIKYLAIEFHDAILKKRGLSPAKLHEWIVSCGYEEIEHLGMKVYRFDNGSLSCQSEMDTRRNLTA